MADDKVHFIIPAIAVIGHEKCVAGQRRVFRHAHLEAQFAQGGAEHGGVGAVQDREGMVRDRGRGGGRVGLVAVGQGLFGRHHRHVAGAQPVVAEPFDRLVQGDAVLVDHIFFFMLARRGRMVVGVVADGGDADRDLPKGGGLRQRGDLDLASVQLHGDGGKDLVAVGIAADEIVAPQKPQSHIPLRARGRDLVFVFERIIRRKRLPEAPGVGVRLFLHRVYDVVKNVPVARGQHEPQPADAAFEVEGGEVLAKGLLWGSVVCGVHRHKPASGALLSY